MNERVISVTDLIKKYNMNVIECYGLFKEIKHIIYPNDKTVCRLCMSPNECFFRKDCRIRKRSEGEI